MLGESSFRKMEILKEIGLKKKEKAQYSGVRVLALSDFKLLVEMTNRSSNGVKCQFLNILFRSPFLNIFLKHDTPMKVWHWLQHSLQAPPLIFPGL